MKDQASEIARRVSEDEIFQALGRAALKARAKALAPGEVIAFSGLEMTVQEDEKGDGIVVQYMCSRNRVERLAESCALQIGRDLQVLDVKEKAEMMNKILVGLSQMLLLWRGISMLTGPGENMTFEMTVYKKDDSWR
jgi:hypothetical protein